MLAPTTENIVTTPDELYEFVRRAHSGQRCCYHRGSLQCDRASDNSPAVAALDELAATALRLSDNKLVHLVQRKEERGFAYLAVRSWRSCKLSGIKELT